MGSTLGSLIRTGSNYIMNEFLKHHFNYMFFFSSSTHQHGWLRKSHTPETGKESVSSGRRLKGQEEGLWEQKHEHLATEAHPGYCPVSGSKHGKSRIQSQPSRG